MNAFHERNRLHTCFVSEARGHQISDIYAQGRFLLGLEHRQLICKNCNQLALWNESFDFLPTLQSAGLVKFVLAVFHVETQDLFTHPSESYLVFDGELVKNADDAAYANADIITLTNNAMMHLFNNIKYQHSGQEIESLFHPGQATMMLGLFKFPDDFQKSTGLNQLWYKDSGTTAHLENNSGFGIRQQYIIQKPDPNETFSFRVLLKHIFGFCDDYEKVVYGFKHQLTLVRKGDNDAIFKTGAVPAGPDNNPQQLQNLMTERLS